MRVSLPAFLVLIWVSLLSTAKRSTAITVTKMMMKITQRALSDMPQHIR